MKRVADSTALQEGGRLHMKHEDRYITLLRRRGKLFCIDSVCFHAGGPLGIGDIEEVNGQPCLICPWHYYKVNMATGDKYYQQIKFENGKMVPGSWASNGVKQRAHTVTEQDGGVYVETSTNPSSVDSDQYASSVACGERVISAGSRTQQGPNLNTSPYCHVGGDGKQLPSGAIMKAARLASQKGRPQSPMSLSRSNNASGSSSSSVNGSSRVATGNTQETSPDKGLAAVGEDPGSVERSEGSGDTYPSRPFS